jgi:coenzyme F420 hydrogenase subunit beta
MSTDTKSFHDLIKEVQEPGFCGRCGGCVSFCSADNLGALKVDKDGMPVFADEEKCLRCGICYMICPNTRDLDDELKEKFDWKPPIGRVRWLASAKTTDPLVAERCTDGGVVTSLLLYLLDKGMIDGALVSKSSGPFQRTPILATTREDIISSAGSHFEESFQVVELGCRYSTYSTAIYELKKLSQASIDRISMVGTPCQINTVRKMQILEVIPADVIKYCFGLFCMENLCLDDIQLKRLEIKHGFSLTQVAKLNVKEEFSIYLRQGDVIHIPFEEVDTISRLACLVCPEFSAEYADISFGGLGSSDGYTTVLIRSERGNHIYNSALKYGYIEEKEDESAEEARSNLKRIYAKIIDFSRRKRDRAFKNRGAARVGMAGSMAKVM